MIVQVVKTIVYHLPVPPEDEARLHQDAGFPRQTEQFVTQHLNHAQTVQEVEDFTLLP